MSQQESVSVNAGDEGTKGPSIEEQYEALKKEGVIEEDGDSPSDALGGAEGEPGEGVDKDDNRPEWLPSKFKTPEDMAKAYAEMERKMGSGGKRAADEDGDEAKDGGKSDEEDYPEATQEERAAAEEATKKAGLDLVAVSDEWRENGGLTDKTYEALEKAGYPKEAVDVYIEGLTSRANRVETAAFGAAGGADAYEEMIQWASDNLSDEEVAAYDEAVNSRDQAKTVMAVKGLKARWEAAVKAEASEEPEEQIGGKGDAKTGSVYQSMDDYMADLEDPRYDKSETFRQQVAAKLGRSNIM